MKRIFFKNESSFDGDRRLKYGEDVRVFYESDTNGTVCVIQIPDDGKENSEQ